MRTKEELACVICQFIMGAIMVFMGWAFLSASTKGYIGLWEAMSLILVIGGIGFIMDGVSTVYSEVTGTPKKAFFGVDDDERP